MKIIHAHNGNTSFKRIREVAQILEAGGVMVYPTDTIYGMGCDVYSKNAIKKITAIKKRDPSKPFSFVCEDISQISQFAFLSNQGYRLINKLLPGPYTFILEARHTSIPKKMLGKRNTVGVRIPDHPVCQQLVKVLGRPIVTTSVNISSGEPLSDPNMLEPRFANCIDVVIDVGQLASEPSTVIDLTGKEPVVIREGKGAIP